MSKMTAKAFVDKAVDIAKKEGADFILGSDPDADRVGILVRDRKDLRPAARRFITEAREIIDQIK